MPETLDIGHLRTLVAIADCGGFGRAAVALHISQPTVSQHVRTLERRLERTFIEKVGRKARFTPAGERLLVQARRILAVHDDALETLDAASENPLALGLTEPAAEQLLPRLLETLRRAFDDRPLTFSLERSTRLAEAVARGVVDLAVILGVGGDLPGRQIATLPLDWYAAPGWQPAEGAPIPLVAYSEPCGMRQRALQQLGAFGHEVRVVAESAGLEGVIAAARAGIGVAVLPTSHQGAVADGLEARRDLPTLGSVNLRLVSRRGLAPDVEDTALAALVELFGPSPIRTPLREVRS
ncbi:MULTISPECIES: LysR family transcriptional regulator [unclassified Rathayibacter]|jgi:DNA-binding transcriptional LysR family regulator|uniref:LysR family transcriptional regulator n=1 Tax=unclassified Rathayibacter TaxID=2609250 RepID=UPI000CE813C5|nr:MULTISPECIES: LysR substrate-binding domain-containing protein [unclassified Rathayibacter]PPG52479.1 LysR family transcriptional regulator [Rathayibacter sp. AY2B3]PPI21690.1 LysR family transcriptional regulator [Rathayibacter sp. AY1B6]PPI26676.1 LysR family transcriptional regulator [Rathayibacter sp. AY1B5]PPI39114.1 LysR family transcriptional regulator [Rathayibacter sp. AY1B1]